MKILFVKPGDRDWINYPAQYAVLSAYLKRSGHEVVFYDASLRMESPEKAFKACSFEGVKALGISVYTASQNWAKEFISLVRKEGVNVTVIAGGPHISSIGIPAVEHLGADIGVSGEGELPLDLLMKRLQSGSDHSDIPGLIYRQNNEWKDTLSMPRLRVKDPDELPYPDYEMIRPETYFDVFRGASVARKREKCAFMFTSRGCPYMCTYCATNCTWEGRITAFSAERVVNEMQYLKEKHGIQEVWFGDDTFTFSRRRTMEICRLLIERKLGLFWRLPNGIRIESIDDELVKMMRKAGCYMTGVGIETGSESAMKIIKKKLDLKIVYDKLKILRRNNILSSGFFIFGFPWETKEQVQETAHFILKSPLDRMQISIFSPYPGSEEFDIIMEKNDPIKYAENVRRYLYEGKIEPFLKYLDLDFLYKKSREVIIKFYLKPWVLFSIIKGITRQQIKDILRHPMIKSMFKRKHGDKDTYVDLNV